jgi:hypothetical protein
MMGTELRLQSHLQKSSHSHPVSTRWQGFHDTLLTVSTVSPSLLAVETVETVKEFFPNPTTRLKPGVNEKTFASGSSV